MQECSATSREPRAVDDGGTRRVSGSVQALFLLNVTLLVAHQIDAAYWQEWELFGIPLGIQFFDAFNLAIVPVLLAGHKATVLGSKHWYRHCMLASFLGILTFALHAAFLLRGDERFRLPLSLSLILFCGISGVALFLVSRRSRAANAKRV